MGGMKKQSLEQQNTSVGWTDPSKKRSPQYLSKVCGGCDKEFPRAEFEIAGGKVTRGKCRPCNAADQRVKDRMPRNRFSNSKAQAKGRGQQWGLTFEEWFALISTSCDYCSGPLGKLGRALDRLDNSRGYVLGNVVPCCELCNGTKSGTYTYGEMKEIGALIRKFRERRAANGEPPLVTWVSLTRKYKDE